MCVKGRLNFCAGIFSFCCIVDLSQAQLPEFHCVITTSQARKSQFWVPRALGPYPMLELDYLNNGNALNSTVASGTPFQCVMVHFEHSLCGTTCLRYFH
jgi:hypothetical protein